jgi:hypothetical protein
MMQIIMIIFIGLETIYPSLKRSNVVKPIPGDAVPGRATVEGDAAESSPVSVSVGVLAPREGVEVEKAKKSFLCIGRERTIHWQAPTQLDAKQGIAFFLFSVPSTHNPLVGRQSPT